MKKVFLGGTCNESNWRELLIKQLSNDVSYFNPVVKDWDEEAYERELKERETSDIVLYVITPKMTGVYSIAEVIDDSNKRPKNTVFCFITADGGYTFNTSQMLSLRRVGEMVERNGGIYAKDIRTLPAFLNSYEGYMEREEEK